MSRERREKGDDSDTSDPSSLERQLTPGKRSGTSNAPNLPPPKYPGKRTLTQHFAPRLGRKPVRSIDDVATAAVENKGSGAALDGAVRSKLEAHLGIALGDVRVHTDDNAQGSAQVMGARAFAHGTDIYLGPGESPTDLRLMAHELAHVAQQSGQPARAQRKATVGAADTPAERHADAVAESVTSGEPAPKSLLVDVAPLAGQMMKAEFIYQLKQDIILVVEQQVGIGATAGCPYISRYLDKYLGQPAAMGEALLRKWIPAAAGVKSARELIPLASARVRDAVRVWNKTGALPTDLVAADPDVAGDVARAPQRKSLDTLESALGPGQGLDSDTAARMSNVVGSDVSGARIHTGPVAQQLAADHDAVAFAVGSNVVMGANAPTAGLEADALLAHELAHTAQQKDAASDPVARKKPIGEEDAAAERDAGEERLRGFAVGFGEIMRTGLQLQRCGGVDPSYKPVATKEVGPDVGKLAYVSHAAASGWFNRHEGHIGATVAASDDEPKALALAKTLGRNLVIVAGGGKYFIYELEVGNELDVELIYGRNAGLQLQPGVFAIVNSRGLVYRGRADTKVNNASPDRGASADPWSAYKAVNAEKGGLEKLDEAELVATFQAAMYDTAMSVLATSESEARDKQKQFETAGATTKEESATIDATARELLDTQKKLDWLHQEFEAHKSMARGVPDQSKQMQLKAEIERGQLVKKKKLRSYPMLGRFPTSKDLEGFVAKSPREREVALAGSTKGVLSDIFSTRENIQTGDLNLWNVPSIVDATMAGLDIGPKSPARKKIKDKASAVSTQETVLSIALAVFSIGFSIAGAVLTGGASLAFTAGALGLGVYDAVKSTEELYTTNAATNTDLDPDGGLLPEEARKSHIWLVVAWAGVALDFADVLKAASVADEVGKVAKGTKSISDAAETLAKGDKKLLERLRRTAGEADLADTISEAMRPGLSGRVGAPITIDGNLGGSVKVLYELDDTGRTLVTGLRVGPNAKIGDILAHADTIAMLDRYSGVTGRIRQAWDRLRSFAGMGVRTNPFPQGSKAFESWQELDKLQGLIGYRRAQLTELLQKAPNATDAQAALRKEIAFLENEANIHTRVVDALVLEKGSGVVAMETSTKEALESGKRLPDAPHKSADDITPDELANSAYYYERQSDGSFLLKEKVDRKGVPQPGKVEAPKPLGSDQVTALRESLGQTLPKAVVDDLHPDTLAALDKLDRSVLTQLKRATKTELEKLGKLLGEDPGLGGRLVGKKDVYGAVRKLPDGSKAIDLDRTLFTRRISDAKGEAKRLLPAIERLSGDELSKLTDGDVRMIVAGDSKLAEARKGKRPGEVNPELMQTAEDLLNNVEGVGQKTVDEIRAGVAHQHGLSDLPFMRNPGAALRERFPSIPSVSMDELVKRHPDALRALENATQEEVERVIRAMGQGNPKDVEDILRSYMYKAQKKARKAGGALEPPSNVGARVEESVGNLAEARARGYPFGFKDKSQYDQFMTKLQSEISARKINGTPKVQGSAMHSKTPGDIDLEILVDQSEFKRLADDFLDNAPDNLASDLKTSIDKQKIPSTQFFPSNKPSIAEAVRPLTGVEGPLEVQATLIVKGSDFDLGPFL